MLALVVMPKKSEQCEFFSLACGMLGSTSRFQHHDGPNHPLNLIQPIGCHDDDSFSFI